MVFFILFKLQYDILQANTGEADQTLHFAASDLGLFYLTMSHKKDARLILWVNQYCLIYMRGFREFFQRGSKYFYVFFFWIRGERIQITL